MFRFTVFLVLIIYFFAGSCSSFTGRELSTYTVSSSDFENIIIIEGYVEPINSIAIMCPGDIEGTVSFLAEDGVYVNEGDLICIVEVHDLQTTYDQLTIELENAEANLAKTKADLNMQYALLEAQVQNNEADSQIALLDSLQLVYATPTQRRIKELELERSAINRVKFDQKLKSLDIIQQSEIKRQELRIQRLQNNIETVQERINSLAIHAPIGGLMLRANYWLSETGAKLQIGDKVFGNMPLALIPEMSEMKVKINASERDFKYINVDDSVFYTFDAMPGKLGWGKIEKKMPIGQQYRRDSKIKFFEIEASVDSVEKMPEPGFTANCHVILKQVKDTIVAPQIAIFEQDSMKVVYVKQKKGFEMRQITTGLSSPKEAIITAGLRRNEIISLSRPESSAIKQVTLLPVATEEKKEENADVKTEEFPS
ncbi:MAG: hypothetical protein FWG22_00920 [Prolixibacteraceae bacterium]|nr:hypothetical protein [Prolixibacteraceae bacterium]